MKRFAILLSIILAIFMTVTAVADVISVDTETATIEEINEAIDRLKALIIERNGGF